MDIQEKKLRDKGTVVGKLVLFWFFLATVLMIWACRLNGDNIPLLLADMRSGFQDNPALPATYKNKLIVLSVFFVFWIITTLVTENFCWEGRILGRKIELTTRGNSMKMALRLCLCLSGAAAVGMASLYLAPQVRLLRTGGWKKDTLIAHACGGIDDVNYTNSLDAFEYSYAQGQRTVEIDFSITSDKKMVCWYKWEKRINNEYEGNRVLSEKEFKNTKIFDKYTTMSLEDLMTLMKKYQDVYVVTDTKKGEQDLVREQFQILVETARATDSMDTLDRFVVQLYNYEMYDTVEEIYHFPNYLLTLYKIGIASEQDFINHCRFCRARGIDVITMWDYWASEELVEIAERYDIEIYVHTVNDMDELEELKSKGVKGFYTDFILPEML